jgi:hypothetical protein
MDSEQDASQHGENAVPCTAGPQELECGLDETTPEIRVAAEEPQDAEEDAAEVVDEVQAQVLRLPPEDDSDIIVVVDDVPEVAESSSGLGERGRRPEFRQLFTKLRQS